MQKYISNAHFGLIPPVWKYSIYLFIFLLIFSIQGLFYHVSAQGETPDTTPPVITCPEYITTVVNKFGCLYTADYEEPTAIDDSGIEPTISNYFLYPGILLGVGVYNDVYTATDAAGNQSSCIVRITVGTIQDPKLGAQTACDPLTNTYSQEVELLFNTIPEPGTITINGQSFPFQGGVFWQKFVLTGLPADGQPVDLTAYITDPTNCIFEQSDFFTAPEPCFIPCEIESITPISQSGCDPISNTYTQTLEVAYNDRAPQTGMLNVNGQLFPITGSPQTVVLEDLPADGQVVAVSASFTDEETCTYTDANGFTAPSSCFTACNIVSVVAGDPFNCDPIADTYSRDLAISYEGTNLNNLMVEINNSGNYISYPVENVSPQIITLAGLPSNGESVDIKVAFGGDNDCMSMETGLFVNPQNCSGPAGDCDITALVAGTQTCEGATFDQEMIMTYEDAPANGSILVKVNNGNWLSYAIETSPQSIILTDLPTDGNEVDIFVKFSDDNGCTFSADRLFRAPSNCIEPPVGEGDGNVLFVVGDAGNLSQGDAAVKARLEGSGYEVMAVSDENSQTSQANGKVLIVISNSVSSGQVGNKFTGSAVPLINYEAYLFDDLGMTNSNGFGQDNGETQVVIQNATHPLAAGLNGFATVLQNTGQLAYGYPGGNAIIAASTDGNSSQATIFGYEVSAEMAVGYAPARRVGIFLQDGQVNNLTVNGWTFFDAAVCWATGCVASRKANPALAASDFQVYPNPASHLIKVSVKLSTDEFYQVDLYDLNGRKVREIAKEKAEINTFQDIHVNIEDIPEGLYILQFSSNTIRKAQKLLVRR